MTASFNGLLNWVQLHPVYQEIREKLQAGLQLPAYITMARARTAIISALITDIDLPVLILTPTSEESQRTVETLQHWIPDPSRLIQFPEPPTLFSPIALMSYPTCICTVSAKVTRTPNLLSLALSGL